MSERRRDSISLVAPAADGVERAGPGEPPTAFRIWRFGENMTDNGMTVFSPRSAEILMVEQEARGNPYSIDIDHMSLNPNAPIENHRAVGRHALEVREDGLWAVRVELAAFVCAGLREVPPAWLSFSPAYDVDEKTREVVSYLNTAITNNPATWKVTQLATRAERADSMISKSDMLAFLKHASENGGDGAAAICAAILAVVESADAAKNAAPPPAPKGEPDGDEPAKEPDGDETASKTDARVIQLLNVLEGDRKRIAEERAAELVATERKTLIASRRVDSKEVLAWLENVDTSIESVRAACRVLPPADIPNLAGAVSVQATRGASNGTAALPAEEAAELDRRMGLGKRANAVRTEGCVQVLGAIDAQEHARIRATRKAGA